MRIIYTLTHTETLKPSFSRCWMFTSRPPAPTTLMALRCPWRPTGLIGIRIRSLGFRIWGLGLGGLSLIARTAELGSVVGPPACFTPGSTHTPILNLHGWLSKLGSFLGALNYRCRIIIGTQKGILILTTTHILVQCQDRVWEQFQLRLDSGTLNLIPKFHTTLALKIRWLVSKSNHFS